ncbi:MAG TPA: hypothetical protein VFA85_03395 [Terriglobales bacterium]|nr:hypothetical protein [Terriglobales bacterium]
MEAFWFVARVDLQETGSLPEFSVDLLKGFFNSPIDTFYLFVKVIEFS